MDKHLRLWEKLALVSLSLLLLAACRAQGERDALRENLIRLHVIAVSDETQEQAVKLRVRDAVLSYVNPLLSDATDASEAREKLFASLDGVAQAAAEAAGGRAVRVTLGPADYQARVFEGGALPAGRYEALRVTLGAGEGHNWWGLIFPQLTLPAVTAETAEPTMAEDGAEPECADGLELRFFTLELWDRVVRLLRD